MRLTKSDKTSYTSSGSFSWTADDQISVLGSDGRFYTFTTASSGKSVSFTGVIPTSVDIGEYAMFWEYRHDDSQGTLRKALCKAIYGKASTE